MANDTAPDQPNATRPPDGPPAKECAHWIGAERRHCRSIEGVRPYLTGLCCPLHTPNALKGLPEPPPGPGWPARAELRAARNA